ncbi:hypothetical protein [Actinoplanes sp. NBRC 103695]|uniref:hypothetical protein n=1 Tax=Actinoplanes sp. NBRC 103695 TaxID=3032202 RepID=UPI002554B8F4|nr:hypothetical protein [Actinoplanes sp. NBRC 103695]
MVDVLAGRRLPRKRVLLAFLRACRLEPGADPRWLAAWNRIAGQRATSHRDTSSADQPPAKTQAQRLLDEASEIRAGAEREAARLLAAARTEAARLQAEAEREALHQHGLTMKLANDINDAGLLRIGSSYLNELEWEELFSEIRELDIFVAYAQTWRNLHARHLHNLASRPGSRIRVFLPDPDDQSTIITLADRFAVSTEELRRRITATHDDFKDLRIAGGADIEIRYRPGDRLYSFYRLDNVAVVGFYSHSRNRIPSIPVLVCRAPGSIFQFITDELVNIEQQSRRADVSER